MTDYRIAAIPTVYRGRRYRSRLEARWAAMFDLLGWAHEYEPFDLGAWSPDFLSRGSDGRSVLVEVKPVAAFDPAVATRMATAARALFASDPRLALMLVGVSPHRLSDRLRLGWIGVASPHSPAGAWFTAPLTWEPDPDEPVMRPDVLFCPPQRADFAGWYGLMTDALGHAPPEHLGRHVEHGLGLWARATSAVQWSPEGVAP